MTQSPHLVLLERERDACARLSYSVQHAARAARSVEAIDEDK